MVQRLTPSLRSTFLAVSVVLALGVGAANTASTAATKTKKASARPKAKKAPNKSTTTKLSPTTKLAAEVPTSVAAATTVVGASATTAKPASSGPPIVVGVVGDVACDPGDARTVKQCRDSQVAELIAAEPDLKQLLVTGDMQYETGDAANFMKAYDKTFGRFRSITLPVPGNHEYTTGNAAGYFEYFGAIAHPETSGYYATNIGASWHVVALNSNCDFVDCGTESPQLAFLKADLAANKRPCVAAIWHHTRFTSGAEHGSDSRTAEFWNVLQKARADVIFASHEHVYERFAPQNSSGISDPNGPIQFVVGTGGRSLYEFSTTKAPNSESRIKGYGFLRVELGSSGLSWKFIPDKGTTTETDSGSATCHPKN
jgi:acid phosphatase type 7